ncbi:MAG: hypothetical protein LBC65_06700 [Oscillospiraceae bacterium]|jgi:acyl carrier protein|nr:hypothetical protein [Oscillospiraceae bacterium]
MDRLIATLLRVNPDIDYASENALISDHVLESLDLITLVYELYSEYQIQLGAEDLTAENFDSAERILQFIELKRS